MSIRIRAWLAVIVAICATAGCSSLRTHYDYDREADFSSLDSFGFVERDGSGADSTPYDNDLVERRIRRAVEEHLVERGFTKSESAPDFRVASHCKVDERLEIRDWSYAYGMRGGRYGYGVPVRDTEIREYEEGTLILDVIEESTGHLIWRGSATRILADNPTPEQSEAAIKEAVDALLADFPPPR